MAYYLFRDGRTVTVLCVQRVMGGRRTQFDLWPQTKLSNPALRGRDALLLSNDKTYTLAHWKELFAGVEPLTGGVGEEHNKLEGEHKKDRVAYIGLGFRGRTE
jgi:hypothetical protein